MTTFVKNIFFLKKLTETKINIYSYNLGIYRLELCISVRLLPVHSKKVQKKGNKYWFKKSGLKNDKSSCNKY